MGRKPEDRNGEPPSFDKPGEERPTVPGAKSRVALSLSKGRLTFLPGKKYD